MSLPCRGSRSFQIGLDHVDDFISGHHLLRGRLLFAIQNMTADVAFQEFSHQAVHSSSGGAHHLQNFGAIALFSKSPHERLYLPLNAPGS